MSNKNSFSNFEDDLGFNDEDPKSPKKKIFIILVIILVVVFVSLFVTKVVIDNNNKKEEQKQEEIIQKQKTLKEEVDKVKESTDFVDSSQLEERNKQLDDIKTSKELEDFEFNEGQANKGSYTNKEKSETILTENPITSFSNYKETEPSLFIIFPRDFDLQSEINTLEKIKEKGIKIYIGIYEKEQDNVSLISSFILTTKESKITPFLRGYYIKDKEIKSYLLEDGDYSSWLNEVLDFE